MDKPPFDLDNHAAYQHWRDTKRACQPRRAEDLIIDVADPRRLSQAERDRLLALCATANMAIYRSPVVAEDKAIPRLLAARMGLHRLDGNWLADDDGISPIAVAAAPLPPTTLRAGPPGGELPAWGGPAPFGPGERPAFIPYTNRPIKWHTDGYYQPPMRQIRAMVLHCVRRAQTGGESAVMDHDMAYIALREANPDWVRALMQPDAMTIPERTDEDGVARAEQTGPVFSVDAASGALHMRYTARTRSIVWKDDAPTRAAVAFLEQMLASDDSPVFRLTLQPGMGLVCNNVLHDRAGFVDDPQQPRLLYRARYLDRIAGKSYEKSAASPREICVSSY